MNILFSSTKEKPEFWFPLLQKALPADRFFAWPDTNGGDIDVAVVATHPQGTFADLPKLKLIQSLWMGVENIIGDTELPRGVPVARLIDPGMVAAMGETVIAYVLDWHRHFYCYRTFQQQKIWKRRRQYLASDRTIGILGLGNHVLERGLCHWVAFELACDGLPDLPHRIGHLLGKLLGGLFAKFDQVW